VFVGLEVFDFVDLVVEDLVVKDLVLEEELLLQGNGEEILLDEVLLDVEHVHLVDGVDGLEFVVDGELVVSVHHTGNHGVHLHHLLTEDEFFWDLGLEGGLILDHLVEEELLKEDILDELVFSEGVEVHGLEGLFFDHLVEELLDEDILDDLVFSVGVEVHGLVGLILHHLVEEELLEEDILDELITIHGGFHGLEGIDWVVDLISEDGGVEVLEGGVDWEGVVLLVDVLVFSGDGVDDHLLGEELLLDVFLWDVVQVGVDLGQEVLGLEVILKLQVFVVEGWDKGIVLQEITFEASDEWVDILVHDHVSTLDHLITEDGGRDGHLGLEEIDNGVDVLVEENWVEEILLEGGDLPELLEVGGGDILLEGGVGEVLTEEGKAHVLTEEFGLVELFNVEDLLVQKFFLHVEGHIHVVTEISFLHGVTQLLQQELAGHGTVEFLEEFPLLVHLQDVHGGLAGDGSHQKSGNDESFHVELGKFTRNFEIAIL